MTLVLLLWGKREERWLDGKYLGAGVDLEALEGRRLMNVLDYEFVEQQLVDPELDQVRSNVRARLMAGYNNDNLYGEANDVPVTPPLQQGHTYTPQTEAGYMGLEPPMG